MKLGAVTTNAAVAALRQGYGFPWQADCGDSTYRNPIIYADYSDPDLIRVGNDFYLTASSFNCTPGLPILHSTDLINWKILHYALKNLPHARYAEVQPGCGIWAPSLRFHAGKFWIFFPMPDEGIYVITATDPAGQWTDPHLLQAGKGLIDPCPLWDDDGKAYLVHAYAGSRAGIKHRLRIRPMAPDGSRLLGEGQIIFHQPEKHPTIEGPKFLKRDGWYYILAPAGGVEKGWQIALRSRNVFGPYEDKIVLEQGDTCINGPHQGALVDTAEGDWWFVHFQDAGIYGRIVHLQPAGWEDGWPVIGDGGEPVLRHSKPISGKTIAALQASDEFDLPMLGLQWQWQANHRDDWYDLGARKGCLRLHPQFLSQPNPALQPNLLLQKFPARSFVIETALDFVPKQKGEEAGLIVAGKASATFALESTDFRNRLVLRIGGAQKTVQENLPNRIRLRLVVEDGGLCRFSFATGNAFTPVSQTFQAQKGVWIGAKAGLYSIKRQPDSNAGHVDVDYFRFHSIDEKTH